VAPLHGWLPSAYAAAPGLSAALFMIMTKVGAYTILRVYTLIFGADAGAVAGIVTPWMLPAALATLVVGALGMLAARSLLSLACFAVVWSMGSLLVAFGLFDAGGIGAGLYYVLHSTMAGATLFLLVDILVPQRGAAEDRLVPAAVGHPVLLSGLFFAAAIAMAGLPPLSGFLGKLMIMEASRGSAAVTWIWAMLLATSLVAILAFARAGSVLFWKPATPHGEPAAAMPSLKPLPVAVFAALLGATVALTAFAGPVRREMGLTAAQILDTGAYVRAVLGPAPLASAGRP
jgi:multicomponent K+:H+ antiporter subunit D